MPKNSLSRRAFTGLLSLALAACGQGDKSGTGSASGEKLAPIAAPAGKAWSDVIAKTAEQDLTGWTTDQAVTKLRGPKGTFVNISVKRPGGTPA